MFNRRALLWVTLVLVPAGVGAQERTVVSNQIAISGRDAGLTLEFSDGVRTELSLSAGEVTVDGQVLGTFAAGDALAASWRALLGEAVSLTNGPLARALVDWTPPTGLSDELTVTAAALDQALENAILGGADDAAAVETTPSTVVEAPAAPGQDVAAATPALAPVVPQAEGSGFSRSQLTLGTLISSPRLLQVIEAVGDMDVDLEEVHAFIGEDVDVRSGESVEGVVLVVDGDLDVRGDVDGDVILAGGRVRLHEGGAIHGDLRLLDARFDDRGGDLYGSRMRVRSSEVAGLEDLREDLRDEIRREFEQQFDGSYANRSRRSIFSPFRHIWQGVAGVLQNLLTFGIVSALGALALYFWPGRIDVVVNTARESLPKAAMVGMAGAFLFIPVWVMGVVALAISIVGIPALIAWVPIFPLAGGLAALFGFLAVSMLVGDWVQEKQIRGFEWADGSSALMRMMAGLFAITLLFAGANVLRMGGPLLGVFHGLLSFVACLALAAMVSIGFGAVLLSRGGRRTYTEGAFMDDDWSWRPWKQSGDAGAVDTKSEDDGVEAAAAEVVDEAESAVDATVEAVDDVVDEILDLADEADDGAEEDGQEKSDA